MKTWVYVLGKVTAGRSIEDYRFTETYAQSHIKILRTIKGVEVILDLEHIVIFKQMYGELLMWIHESLLERGA